MSRMLHRFFLGVRASRRRLLETVALAGLMCCMVVSCESVEGGEKVYTDRWVYVSRGLGRDEDVGQIREIVKTASEHGLNGMVLSAGLDRLSLRSSDHLRRLQEVKDFCQEYKVEIIPIIFSVGYGGSVLGHNLNLAAGLPVKDALFVVEGNEAQLMADPQVQIVNGGFEEFEGNRLKGYKFHDKPGQISFVDQEIVKEGKASLRLEHFGEVDPEHGHARIMQEVNVHPHRYYRVTCWVKTEGSRPQGAFRILVLGGARSIGKRLLVDGRSLAPYDPQIPETTDWREVTMAFNSLEYHQIKLYAGLWNGKAGRVWLDDLRIEEIGLVNVLRRPGTPVTVTSQVEQAASLFTVEKATSLPDQENGKIVYQEGKDYQHIADPDLGPWRGADHDPPPIHILPNSRIKDGQRLWVSFYHSMAVNRSQVSACMSEPEVYDIWRKEARLLHEQLQPQKYLLSMDEIRAGGSCVACKERSMTMAEILGDCITKQVEMLRDINPDAEIYIWSDMLDPNHNAHGDYYLVDGDFTGSWKHVPEDLIIVCWYHRKREESLKFFSDLGFRTLAGAYYDGDTLDNPRDWLETLNRTSGARGIMYTTWQNRYALLAGFGDLVTRRKDY